MTDNFNFKVQRLIERLQHGSYQAIEAEIAQKRLAWFRQHAQRAAPYDHPTPRQAFELLFFENMGLSPADLPVVSETETEIVWLSANLCPTLEAVKTLGLDTRTVCRATNEKSTQAFVSQARSAVEIPAQYQEIRPHAPHCREMIVRVDFEALMALALEEAQVARQAGNPACGAVVVLGKRILSRAHHTAATQRDPSLHAEVNAIRQAVQVLGDDNLSGAILFSTCEPCPLCSSQAVRANLTTIVYGAPIEEPARPGQAGIHRGAADIVAQSPVMVEVIGGVLRDECLALRS